MKRIEEWMRSGLTLTEFLWWVVFFFILGIGIVATQVPA